MLAKLLPVVILAAACTRAEVRVEQFGAAVRPANVTVSPVVVVSDIGGAPAVVIGAVTEVESLVGDDGQAPPTALDPVKDAAFLRNELIGNVRFGGGFVRTGAVALETRARIIEAQPSDALRAQGTAWLSRATSAALRARRVVNEPAAKAPENLALSWLPVRGEDPEDGHDNLNLPRSHLVPVALDPAGMPGTWLVPYLRAYYTHNGGWFLGQRWGCMAGARVDAEVVLYVDGKPVWWMEATGRSLDERTAQATTAELDQHLLNAERQVEDALSKGLFR